MTMSKDGDGLDIVSAATPLREKGPPQSPGEAECVKLSQSDISAIAAEVVRQLLPMLSGRELVPPPAPAPVPGSYLARRQAALEIAAKKGCLKGRVTDAA